MNTFSKWMMTASAALLLGACGAPPTPSEDDLAEPRAETQGIRNTENVGYGGNAIADKLDAALDANDARTAVLDQQIDNSASPSTP